MSPQLTQEADRGPEVELHQIGEVAERVGLSLRTVRYHEEVARQLRSEVQGED